MIGSLVIKEEGSKKTIIRKLDNKEQFEGTVTYHQGIGYEWKNAIGKKGVEKTEGLAFLMLGFKLRKT